jgi:hypothetical protein
MRESDGVIQYRLDHRPGELPPDSDYQGLFDWFRRCRRLSLIGRDPGRYGGFAFGNISVRAPDGFVISGTQTGGHDRLDRADLAWVRQVDAAANRLQSQGPARPSSEAMTHGEVYRQLARVAAVIHVHSPVIWRAAAALGLPSTPPEAAYGSPAMAREVALLLAREPQGGVLAMGGHEDGILAYGRDMDDAGRRLLAALAAAEGQPAAGA